MSTGFISDPYATPGGGTFTGTPGSGVFEITLTTALAPSLSPIISGTTNLHAETYNGGIPGPTFRLTVGDTVICRLVNNLPHATGIHWHGIELSNSADGTEVTQAEVPRGIPPIQTLGGPFGVPAGGTYLYKFKVTRPGIYWYHPHHHHSTNRVFKGLYGMIVVTDLDENTLIGNTLPSALDTKQIVLSDVTVCKAVGSNIDAYTLLVGAERLGGPGAQPGTLPQTLCELPTAVDDHGDIPLASYGEGDIPSLMVSAGRVNEGQIVLTNGVNVGPRSGTPALPGAVPLDATTYRLPVLSGQGLRLQFVNCATTRYFRLRLTDGAGVQVPLVRVGGEGGLLDNAVLEGLTIVPVGTFDPMYDSGEILLPPSVRADVVVAIPPGLAVGTVLTVWTRDFKRLGAGGGGPWVKLPTVPVMHLEINGSVVGTPYTIVGGFNGAGGTPLRAKPVFPGPLVTALPVAPNILLDPNTIAKPGDPALYLPPGISSEIQLSQGTPSVNGIDGLPLHGPILYPLTPHIGSTRYAEKDHVLELTVKNVTDAHHPFHLHGFSMQPKLIAPNVGTGSFTWAYQEFRDSINVPANHTLTFRVSLDDRMLVDGLTPGGHFGRWLFHCHVFFHHHRGMIGEFVVTNSTGKERPTVDTGGSWAYAPSGLTITREGTFFSLDGSYPVNLIATLFTNAGVLVPLTPAQETVTIDVAAGATPGEWSWINPVLADGIYYVYITGTDSLGLRGQAVYRLKIGMPDDGSDWGDPHIHTVDGKAYDFQAAGEFTLLVGEGIQVQARQTPVLTANPITDWYSGLKSCVSLNTAAAALVGKHRIAFQPGREPGIYLFFVDGKPAQLTTEGINLDGNRVSGFDVNGKMALRVDYEHLAVLIVTPHFWSTNNVWYLTITISRTGADSGLMGAIPANTWLPLLQNGGSVGPMPPSLSDRYTALYKTFADSWRITDQSSLFVYEKGTSTSTFTDKNWPAGEPPCKLLPQFEIPGWVIPQGMDIDKAKQICNIITEDGLNKDCVFDVATTGDADFAKAYRITQELRQRSTGVQIVSTKPGEITVIVSPLVNRKQPVPKGRVNFYIDNVETGQPIELDAFGHVQWKISGLDKGTYTIRAVYIPANNTDSYPSSSPNLKVTLSESTKGHDGGINTGRLYQPYVWIVLVLIVVLLLIWMLF